MANKHAKPRKCADAKPRSTAATARSEFPLWPAPRAIKAAPDNPGHPPVDVKSDDAVRGDRLIGLADVCSRE